MQAEILAVLCNDLLSTAPIRTEIDKREADGHLISGRGGEGGAMPMRSREEREQRQSLMSTRTVSLLRKPFLPHSSRSSITINILCQCCILLSGSPALHAGLNLKSHCRCPQLDSGSPDVGQVGP